jgi:hypothetical protein
MSPVRKVACLTSLALALALLVPGLTQTVLSISGDIERARLAEVGIDMLAGESESSQSRQMLAMISQFLGLDQVEGRIEVFAQSRSILGFAGDLSREGYPLVALLILTFSVVVPVFKAVLQALALLLPRAGAERLLGANAALSKWSMADVFVMALLVAFLAGRASGHAGDVLRMQAQLGPGFYYFLGYCLFSIAAGALLTAGPGGASAATDGPESPRQR